VYRVSVSRARVLRPLLVVRVDIAYINRLLIEDDLGAKSGETPFTPTLYHYREGLLRTSLNTTLTADLKTATKRKGKAKAAVLTLLEFNIEERPQELIKANRRKIETKRNNNEG
jgi:hypothetical protein